MSDDRWQRIKSIFESALELQGELRDELLDAECAGDETLRSEVESLLAASPPDSGFLEGGPAIPPSVALPTRAGGRETVIDDPAPRNPSRGGALPRRCPSCGALYDSGRRVCAADGTVLDEDFEALVGTTFDGRYRVEAVLGRGGMGIVLRARHDKLDDVVAIKLLDDRYASDPSALRRFVREGQIARRFHHPAVVGIHDLVCGDTGPVYLVLEYVEGRTLGTLLRERGQLSPEAAVDIVRPIADALDAAHARGIVHRDLKPDNIMVREAPAEPRAKLLDLGIAITRATEDYGADTRLTRQGHWIGTPLYMAPEQWNASTEEGLDGRADVYALGVVVHQLVAGAPPFTGDISALRSLHAEGRPRRLDSAVAGVPAPFADAVLRAMAKDRRDRFATAGVFVAALESALSGWEGADSGRTLIGGGDTSLGRVDPSAPTLDTAALDTGESARHPGNLPAQATSFVAPPGSIDEVAGAFEHHRCVTLTGPGGIGKTRLSLEAAARLEDRFPGGAWFVELAAISDPLLVTQCVANALGARERPGEPLSASIHDRIGASRLLLVLDNCEHVIDGAADVARDLLRACPRAAVLATSREALAIPGENVVAVSPLEVPESGAKQTDLLASPAVHLFLDRARAATPSLAPSAADLSNIAAICRRVDGLPLAIELAAARVRALGLSEVLSRLDDRFRLLAGSDRGRTSRQRTLHAAIDWSYRMLRDEERALLCRLAVFAGGATLETLERVCPDADEPGVVALEDVANLVDSLVTKSLVVAELEREPVRYRMFESIRAFALERLDESGERARVESRVDNWVVSLARSVASSRSTPEQQAVQDCALAELDTVRQSFERLLRRDDSGESITTAAGSLGALFESCGMLTEGRAWLNAAIEAGASQADRGLALYWSGVLAIDQGDYAAGEARLEAARAHSAETRDRAGMARVMRALSYLSMRRNIEQQAVEYAREAAEIYAGLGDVLGEAASTHLMATVEIGRGDYAAARPLLERIAVIHRQRGDERSLAIDCYSLGEVLAGLGEMDAARRAVSEAVEIAARLGDTQTLAYSTYVVGWVAAARGDATSSLEAYRKSLELLVSVGDDAATVYAVEGVASALAIASGSGRAELAERAVELASAAAAKRVEADQPLSAHEQRTLDGRMAAARAALDERALAAAEARGATLVFERAVAEALGMSLE